MGLLKFLDVEAPQTDIPEKNRGAAGTLLHLYASKLSKFVATNLIFFIANIPAIIISYIAVVFLLPMINTKLSPTGLKETVELLGITVAEQSAKGADVTMQIFVSIVVFVALFVVGMTLVCTGPVQTGLCYVYRNYVRRKPTMLWSDFVFAVKRDWKQSLAASVVSFLITGILLANLAFYNTLERSFLTDILLAVFGALTVFFLCVQLYIYPMIASVNLKLSQVFRNAALLFIARFPQTVGIIALNIVFLGIIPGIMLFTFTSLGLILAMLYYAFFAFSFVHLMNTFFVWRQIERYMMKKEEEPAENSEDSLSDETAEVTSSSTPGDADPAAEKDE